MALGSFQAQLAKLRENARNVSVEYNDDLDDMMIDAAIKGEAFMKENAPWEDNDGNRKDRVPGEARASLFTVPDLEGDTKEIVFSHGVDYGIWLEVSHSGRYEIILPAVKAIGDALMAATEGSLNIRRRRLPGDPAEAVAKEQAKRAAGAA